MTAFPQYVKTTNPEVIATIETNQEGYQAFHKRACDFSLAQGVERGSYFPSSFAGSHAVRAVGGDTKPETGRWTKGYGGYGWRPFKNNPLAQEMEDLRFVEEAVPGLPGMVYGPYNRDFSRNAASPRPFLLDGAAYVGFGFAPRIDEGEKDVDFAAYGWTEILASEYMLAVETYNARIKEAKSDD